MDRSVGAGNGIRTRDIKLGKLALYQLSYARLLPSCERQSRPALPTRSSGCGAEASRYTDRAMRAPGTDLPGLESGEALYFFPDQPLTASQLRRLLAEGERERRAWAISHLLRYADWDDIWAFVNRDEVRSLFADLDLPPSLRVAWARFLEIETAPLPGR